MPGMTDVEAAEFADYVRDERERGGRDAGVRPGGMYRRAMMRAYAEAVGAEGELAPRRPEGPAAHPPPAPAPAPAAAPSAVGVVRPAMPRPRGHDRRASAPPQALLGAAGAALAAVAAVVIWSLTPGTPPTVGGQQPPAPVVRPTAPQVPAAPSTIARASAPAPRAAAVAAGPVASRAGRPRPAGTDGTLSVTSQPSGARVTVNGIGWGETPVTIRHLDFGPKRIRLTLQGYVSQERVTLLSVADPSASARFVLRRRPAPATARAPVAGAR
jgi:hypothetical protein